jgi:predicted lysophospholipase L1 biosynthesis ABC-type transport system permease subunit
MVPSKLSLWYGILIGALAFGADEQITYSLVPHACSTGHIYVLYWATAIALLFALSGAGIATKNLAATQAASIDGGTRADRSRFMAILGIAASLGFATIIIAMAVPRFLLSPCE